MKAAATLVLSSVMVCQALLGAEPPELERLRNSYEGAVVRSMKPLSETYITELKRLRDQYTRTTKLEEANAVQAEIMVITEKLKALTTAPSTTALDPSKVMDTVAVIPAAGPGGFKLPPLRRGDTILLSYVSGMWKCDGNIASENPDAEVTDRGDRVRLVLAEGPSKDNNAPGSVIKIVPPGTKEKPFTYVVQTTRDDVVLRIHSGSENPRSPGSVTYTVTVLR